MGYYLQTVTLNNDKTIKYYNMGLENEILFTDLKTLKGVLNRIKKFIVPIKKDFIIYRYNDFLHDAYNDTMQIVYKTF